VINILLKNEGKYFMEDFIEIGAVAGAHGIKGEIKIIPFTFDNKRFSLLREVILIKNSSEKIYTIENVKYQQKFVILKLEGVNDIPSATGLKGSILSIPRDLALPLGDDEYYIGDVIGCAAFSENGDAVGEVAEIIETGANDVYIIAAPGNREILLPAIKQCVLGVDILNK